MVAEPPYISGIMIKRLNIVTAYPTFQVSNQPPCPESLRYERAKLQNLHYLKRPKLPKKLHLKALPAQ
jgi:hypothetical protein